MPENFRLKSKSEKLVVEMKCSKSTVSMSLLPSMAVVLEEPFKFGLVKPRSLENQTFDGHQVIDTVGLEHFSSTTRAKLSHLRL